MSLDDFARRFLDDPKSDDAAKDNIRSLMTSHLTAGMQLQQKGLLREAIEEYAKENDRPIRSDIDAEITQKSYGHIGMVYRQLGELESAEAAFQKARELWKRYHVGVSPHHDLAEMLIEQGKLDEAIGVCQELLEDMPDGGIKRLHAKAVAMKKGNLD